MRAFMDDVRWSAGGREVRLTMGAGTEGNRKCMRRNESGWSARGEGEGI